MSCQFMRAVLVFVPLSLTSVATLTAQGQNQAPPPIYQPPAMRFGADGLSLIDALKLTLQHDPNIKLSEAEAEFRRGTLRSERGLFDWTLGANGNLGRNQAKLTDSQVSDLQESRDKLAQAVVDATKLSQSLATAGGMLADKNAAYNNSAGWNLSTIKDETVNNQMSILQSQLALYKDLLASPMLTDPKVRTDIVALRDQTLGKTIDYFNSQQTAIAAVPGQLQTRLDHLGPTPEEQWSKQADLRFDVAKLFRSGIRVTPYADVTYHASNYVGKDSTDPEYGGMGIDPLYEGKVGFDLVLPLLRGAGRKSVAAGEIAAGYDLDASRMALLHMQSQSVFTTIQAYWEARSLADQVDVLRRSVEIQGELGNVTRALIAANEKPRSDEARVLASTAESRSRYEAAQRQLVDARVNLAQTMGVALADALSLPLASDPFPQPPDGLQIDPDAYPAFVQESLSRRFDRQSALKSEASGKALVEGAKIDTRPLLNVTAGGWGSSVHQDTPALSKWVFRSGSVGADFQVPFGNNTALGALDQRQASLNQTSISSANLARQIGLNVVQFAESLRVSAERLRSARESVRNYDQTIVNEQARFKAGDSSLVDTILTEQQTTNARLSLVAAQAEYATLLAALRYQAGLLVQDGSVDAVQLVAVPAALVRR
jgi:outer membrane protein TolC